MQCGGFGWDGPAGCVTVDERTLTFEGQCPFKVDWLQERHIESEANMMDCQMPSRQCFHDYPQWEYDLIRLWQALKRKGTENA
jgi:hypothetical protein